MALFDFMIAIVIAGVLLGGLVFIWTMRQHQVDTSQWEVREHSLGNGIAITIEKPNEKPFTVGAAMTGPTFDEDLAWLRAQAKSDRDNLRRGRKILT